MRKIKFISILLVLSMLLTVPAFAFSTGFTDVSEKATYAEAVSYLADAGILRGMASGRFAPNEKITVSQWATMLCRAFDTEPEGVSWQEVGANAVQIAVRSSWLDPTAVGDANGSYLPRRTLSDCYSRQPESRSTTRRSTALTGFLPVKTPCASARSLAFVLRTRLQRNSSHALKPRSFFMPS